MMSIVGHAYPLSGLNDEVLASDYSRTALPSEVHQTVIPSFPHVLSATDKAMLLPTTFSSHQNHGHSSAYAPSHIIIVQLQHFTDRALLVLL